MYTLTRVLIGLALLTASCSSADPTTDTAVTSAESDVTPAWPDGIFEMTGYGFFFEITDGVPHLVAETQSTCGQLGPEPIRGFRLIESRNDAEGNEQLIMMDAGDAITRYNATRASSFSRGCALTNTNTNTSGSAHAALALMEVLEERYPHFDTRGVSWPELRQRYEGRLAATENPDDFAAVASDLFAEIGDGHTAVDGQLLLHDEAQAIATRLGEAGVSDDEARARIGEYMADVPLAAGTAGRSQMAQMWWGLVDQTEIGYVRMDALHVDHVAAERALLQALSDLDGPAGLIVDLRLNSGGSDLLVNKLAGYLTPSDYPAYTKFAGSAREATRQSIVVAASDRAFAGPLAVLTSPLTASAAENLILTLRARPEPAVVIGSPTTGEFSDAIPWLLPNNVGITVGMEVHETVNGVGFESVGLTPDIEHPFEPWLTTQAAGAEIITVAVAALTQPASQ